MIINNYLSIINNDLMVFEEKGDKYDLLIILIELCGIVLLQHKTQHDLMKYEIVIYTMYVLMHVPQLNLILFSGNVNYDLKVLTMNKIVRSLHVITLQFWFGIKNRKKNKKKTLKK